MIADDTRSIEAAQHVLGYYNAPGFPRAGSFTNGLIELIGRADPSNRARLLASFPEYRVALDALTALGLESLALVVRAAEQAQQQRRAIIEQEIAARTAPPSLRIIGRLDDDA